MIDPSAIDLSTLPWLPLDARSAFPRQAAIYFAIDSQNNIQYIGRSKNPKGRWGKHDRYSELNEIGGVKIAYLFVDAPELLPSIEAALIDWFDPPLNVIGRRSPKRIKNQSTLKVLNRVKEFADNKGLTAYALWKATTLSEPTVYRLYKDPTLIPSGKVLEGFAEAFPETTPNDWLKFERG